MSDSTLFRRLHDYEKHIGKLFIRQNGQYQLSRLGQSLLAPALEAEKQHAKIDAAIHAYTTPSTSTIKVTAPTSYAYRHLPEIFEQLRGEFGDLVIEIITSNQPLNLDNEQADIALRVTNNPPENYIGKKIATIAWGAYASDAYLNRVGYTPSSLDQLNGLHVIVPAGELLTTTAITTITRDLTTLSTVATDDLVTMAEFAQHGHGIALLPDEFYHPSLHRLFTAKPLGTNQLWLLTHTESRKRKSVTLVARALAESLKQRLI